MKENCLGFIFCTCQAVVNSLPTSGDFCRLLISFANSLDPDKARRFVRPDLNPNCLAFSDAIHKKI